MAKTIDNIDKILAISEYWRPFDTRYLKSFYWADGSIVMTLTMAKREGANAPPSYTPHDIKNKKHFDVKMVFTGVESFHLDVSGIQYHSLDLNIEDVSENGYESLNFLVDDYERGTLKFWCKEIDVISVGELYII